MQELLSAYLFQYKKCPLPGTGTLFIKRHEAVIIVSDKKILPPTRQIFFEKKETDAADLHDYIAVQKGISREEAAQKLSQYSETISNLQAPDKISITDVGEFYRDADGSLEFLPAVPVSAFAPEVQAERVIHPHEEHPILVGDTETTNTEMTEYYAEEAPSRKNRWWWIAAIVLFALAALLVVFYMDKNGVYSTFGISHQYDVQPAPETYKKLP